MLPLAAGGGIKGDENQVLHNNAMIDYQGKNNGHALFKSCIYMSFQTLSDWTNCRQALEEILI